MLISYEEDSSSAGSNIGLRWLTQNKLRGLSRRRECQLLRMKGCRVVSITDPYSRNLGFLDRSRYFFFQVAPQLYSRGRVDAVPDALLLRKSRSAGNRSRDL
jgi:hypothetical protein